MSRKGSSEDVVVEEGREVGTSTRGKHETDEAHRMAQWQKQIDYGKNTLGYQTYLKLIPKGKRRREDPMTPIITQDISKKRFDGQIRAWRRMLHKYDEAAQEALKDQPSSNPRPPSARGSDMQAGRASSSEASNKKRDHKGAFQEAVDDKHNGRTHSKRDVRQQQQQGGKAEAPKEAPEPPRLQQQQEKAKECVAVKSSMAKPNKAEDARSVEESEAAPEACTNVFDMIMNEGGRSWMDICEEEEEEDIKL